jgi:tetratricopeptide (TPR) repeat protein
MKQLRRWWIVPALLAVAAGTAGWWFWQTARQPNLLIITLDTTRADRLGAYGCKSARTPVLDRLAADGIVFDHALTSVPLTLPSHATMFTGLWPPEHGLRINGMGSLPSSIPFLPELLQRQGYATGAFLGAFVLDRRFGLSRGFNVYDDELQAGSHAGEGALHRRRDGKIVVDRALAWLRQISWRPFCCWVHLYDPHPPWKTHPAEPQFPGDDYDAEIAYADSQVGRLIEELRASGKLNETLILVVGDHGEGLGDHNEVSHGKQLYDSTLRVPFIVHWPSRYPTPRRIKESVSLVDLLPTTLDCLNSKSAPRTSGRSLRSALTGAPLPPVPIYAETYDPFFSFHHAWQNALIFEGWKYIHSPTPELYHFVQDPSEQKNLIAERPDERQKLEVLLLDLKSRLTSIKPAETPLDEQAKRTLSSLGYTRHVSQELPPDAEFRDLPDVKDAIVPYQQTNVALDLRDKGQGDEAETLLRRVVTEHPGFRYARVFYAETLASRALALPPAAPRRQEMLKEAEELCRKILAEERTFPDRQKSAVAFLILAGLLSERASFSEANTLYEHAARVDPEWAPLYLSWGQSLEKSGDITTALQKYQLAAAFDPGLLSAQMRSGDLLLRQSREFAQRARAEDRQQSRNLRAQAEQHFRLAIKANPGFLQAYSRIYAMLEEEQLWPQAATLLESALTANPRDAEARYQMAFTLFRQEKTAAAVEQLRLLLKQAPHHEKGLELLQQCEQRQSK